MELFIFKILLKNNAIKDKAKYMDIFCILPPKYNINIQWSHLLTKKILKNNAIEDKAS